MLNRPIADSCIRSMDQVKLQPGAIELQVWFIKKSIKIHQTHNIDWLVCGVNCMRKINN